MLALFGWLKNLHLCPHISGSQPIAPEVEWRKHAVGLQSNGKTDALNWT